MKRLFTSILLLSGVLASTTNFAQSSPPQIQFDSVKNFLKLPPNVYFGEVAGIAVNSKKRLRLLSKWQPRTSLRGSCSATL